ncbi:hypothetical protein K443DRAFT_493121 [Laccaria amethystina LaAM-08-1]|uniref:Uncharacterized protein n=1 Tax=Laccaria amethystina LaAM-08-1 TaxID=1095629 RepID=A0A0C9Y4D1_9AGAR|nr:hypothetical protein K443DRAFT_493121 [Laccaria amethystina LaAM-08-1]
MTMLLFSSPSLPPFSLNSPPSYQPLLRVPHSCMDRPEQDELITLAAQPYTFSFSALCLFKYIYNHQLTPLFINLYSRCNSFCVQLAFDTTSLHPPSSHLRLSLFAMVDTILSHFRLLTFFSPFLEI